MSIQTPQNQLFSASGSRTLTPGATLRTFSQELLQVSCVRLDYLRKAAFFKFRSSYL